MDNNFYYFFCQYFCKAQGENISSRKIYVVRIKKFSKKSGLFPGFTIDTIIITIISSSSSSISVIISIMHLLSMPTQEPFIN